MAVPKKKSSPMCRGMRNSHCRVRCGAVSVCAECGDHCLSHHMCLHCGYYKGRQVIIPRAQRRKLREMSET